MCGKVWVLLAGSMSYKLKYFRGTGFIKMENSTNTFM